MNQLILVAAAWPYANGVLHIGRVAGALLPADIFARYHRLKKNHVLFVSGSDTHGTPITLAAEREGVSPQVLFERYHQSFLNTQTQLGISFDLFSHTDTENHTRVVQDIFLRLYEKGYIYPQTQTLLYNETLKRFLPDRYVEGVCPYCQNPQARGDQCDSCGRLLDAIELGDPRCILDGTRPVPRKTKHLFLDLPAFQERLLSFFETHKEHWRPHPYQFSRSFLQNGLKGRPITRDLDWGIPVPLAGWEHKKLYIWFENVIGYLSASIEWSSLQNRPEAWKKWWYQPDARSFYFLGKDNIPFHTIIWPAQLLGIERLYEEDKKQVLRLPYDVPANHYLSLEGKPFSTSRNHAVWLPDLLEKYPVDTIRYGLAALLPESSDTNFTWKGFLERNNQELVATWGNVVHRVLSFAWKHFDKCVPVPDPLRVEDQKLLILIEKGFQTVDDFLEQVKLRAALRTIFSLAKEVNRYLSNAPWFQVIQTEKENAATTVYTALCAIDSLKILLAPFLPHSCQKLHTLLGYKDSLFGKQNIETSYESQASHKILTYESPKTEVLWKTSTLPPGQRLQKPFPLYKKLDLSLIETSK